MTDAKYQDRQEFEMEHWPELREAWNKMIQLTMPEREVSGELKQLSLLLQVCQRLPALSVTWRLSPALNWRSRRENSGLMEF